MVPRIHESEVVNDERLVECIRAVCQKVPGTDKNHWSIFLNLVDKTQPWYSDEQGYYSSDAESENDEFIMAVRVNMSRNGSNLDGLLNFTELQFLKAYTECRSWEFVPHRRTTVGHVARLIYAKKRDLYTMSASGTGCRHWVYTVLGDLETEGFLEEDAASDIREEMNYRYYKNRNREELEWVEGVFDEEE